MRILEFLKLDIITYVSIFILASSAGFLNYFKLFGFSLTNWVVFGILVIILVSLNFKNVFKIAPALIPHILILFFLLYGAITTLLIHNGFHDKSSLQNLFVYVLFFIFLLFSTFNQLRNSYKILNFLFLYLLAASFIIEVIELYYFGLRWGDNLTPKIGMFLDARSLSIGILLTIGWFLSIWIVKKSFFAFMSSILGIILIYINLSRMALIIGIFLITITFFIQRFRNIKKESLIFITTLLLFVFFTLILNSPLQERYIGSTGVDTHRAHPISKFTNVGNIAIDTSGREGLWKDVYNSYVESYIWGKGIGSAEKVNHSFAYSDTSSIQPCNDHLRVLHDFGSIGYLLLLSQVFVWIFLLIKSYSYEKSLSKKIIYLNACLAIFSIGAIAVSDNPFVYSYIMLPLAIIIGTSFNSIYYANENSLHS